VDQNSVKAKAD